LLRARAASSPKMSSSTGVVEEASCGGGESKKTSWPEVVGLPAKEAKEIILKDMPDAHVVVVPLGSPVTTDFRTNLSKKSFMEKSRLAPPSSFIS
jgi:hypothetical protein